MNTQEKYQAYVNTNFVAAVEPIEVKHNKICYFFYYWYVICD